MGNYSENYLHLNSGSSYQSYNLPETIRGLSYFDTYKSPQLIWPELSLSPFVFQNNTYTLPLIRPIYDIYSSDIVGWIYVNISSNIITNALNDYDIPPDSELYLTINEHTYHYQNNTLFLLNIKIK